ncbi:copper chaperone PCu(A)C [Pseudaminobacter sp. 19-2017]|uniref:Copper chaperone PCu(A)C n=1 Tax=Pseudaminobacter soli (ex Zhang et al. 2022) TaxID=2831468 RepID=A0A942E7H3_9HYPH|nr:copper chaperone PCu(A)C [Pseudaminobacter soli]MBS3651855.1 copper chaperone PCu(A)C [Pseudaminobacter soli]
MTDRWPSILLVAMVCLFLPLATIGEASAHSYKLGSIAIGHVWAPVPPEGVDGLPVYGAILNQGADTVSLVDAESPVAGEVRFRLKVGDKETWPLSISLVPNKPLGLAEWREHIWVTGLKTSPAAGDTFELVLDFGDKGKVTTMVIVEDEAGH